MKTKLILSIIYIIIVSGVYAQDSKKEWEDGKLKWDDFQEKTISIGNSELKYVFGYSTDKLKVSDTTFIGIKAYSYMDKNLSWIKKEYKNDRYLKYNQVIFDLTELYRRKFQHEIYRVNSTYGVDIIFNQQFKKLNEEVDRFQQESNYGQDINIINKWELIISNELNNTYNPEKPKFSKKNFGYALHAGFGAGFFTGSLGEHFGPTFNFIFGFDFAFKKSILYINATLASGKVNKNYLSDKSWYKSQNAKVAIIDLSYGYAIIDKSKIKLSPFVGLGITELSGENKNDKEDALRNVEYNFSFGLNADYKIRKRIKLIPNSFSATGESVETSIRARLYITRANFFDDLNGYSINLTIGLCGFGNLLRINE